MSTQESLIESREEGTAEMIHRCTRELFPQIVGANYNAKISRKHNKRTVVYTLQVTVGK